MAGSADGSVSVWSPQGAGVGDRVWMLDDAVTAVVMASGAVVAGTKSGHGHRLQPGGGTEVVAAGDGPVVAATVAGGVTVLAAGSAVHFVSPAGGTAAIASPVGTVRSVAPVNPRQQWRGAPISVVVGGVGGVGWLDAFEPARRSHIDLPTVEVVASSPAGRVLAAGDLTGSLHVCGHRCESGVELSGYPDGLRHLAWLGSGAAVVVASDDELTVWEVDSDGDTADEPLSLVGHRAAITAVAAPQVSDAVATADADGTVLLWRPLRVDLPVARCTVPSAVVAMAWDNQGRRLAIGGTHGDVTVVDVTLGIIA
jgi:WD40 repeat protein